MLTIKTSNIDCAEIELDQNDIIQLKYRPDYTVELEDVREVERVFIDLSNGNDIYCLLDMSGQFNVYTPEAQKFLSKEASIVKQKKIKCSAVVIDNLPNRLITKFFIKFYKPPFRTKIFANKESGLIWIESIKNGSV